MKFKLKQLNIIPRRRGWILLLLSIVSLSFFIPTLALAQEGVAIAQFMSEAIVPIINFFVWLLTSMIGTLVKVAQYNNFINSAAVSKGWIIIRDLFNILFVIILLIIAFATVLKLERYHYKRMLASFLIAAVLVNFSKLICGILIDITQVMMLTFVKAFKDTASGNFIEMLGLTRLLSVDSKVAAAAGESFGSVITATLLALIMAIISTVVVGIILFVFLFRIVMIWILVILSPLAFIATVLPATQGYGRQWWQKFTSQLIIGPILAFFLWLSLAIAQDPGTDPNSLYQKEPSPGIAGTTEEIPGQLTEASQPQYMLNFMLSISMLIGSLMVTQQLGVAGASMAGKGINRIQGMATGLVKGTTKLAFKGADRIVEKGTKMLGGAFGAKDFKGISYDILKTGWQMRKGVKAKRRKDYLEDAGAGVSDTIETVLDPGVWSKTIGDVITGAKKKIKLAVQIKEKIEIDIKVKDKDIKKEDNKIDQLNQEKNNTISLADQLKTGPLPQIKEDMTAEEKEKIKASRETLKGVAQEAMKDYNDKYDFDVYYDIETEDGRMGVENYLRNKAKVIDKDISGSEETITQLEGEKKELTDQSNEQATNISKERYKSYLGIKERKKPKLKELQARRRQGEEVNDLLLTTGGDQELLIESIKKSLSQGYSGSDKAIAAIELLVKVHGQNAALNDPTIQAFIRKKMKVKFPKKDAQGKNLAVEDFNKNPVTLPAWQMFLEHTFKDVAHYNDYEATRGIARIGSIGAMAGNPALAGLAHFDPLTGLPELGGIIQKQDGGLDIDKTWAKVAVAKMHQIEAQAFWRMVHSDAFTTEDRQGKGYNIHAAGKEYLKELDGNDIVYMNRIRGDTLTRLTNKRVLKQINDFADQVSQGKVEDVDPKQASIIKVFANRLIDLKTKPPKKVIEI